MSRVLLVEDAPEVSRLCERLLARQGASVCVVRTAAEALACLDADPSSFALALVDVGLPDASGLDVAAHARKLRPDLPIVVVTGYLDAAAAEGYELLRKPFTLATFHAAVEPHLAVDEAAQPEGSCASDRGEDPVSPGRPPARRGARAGREARTGSFR